MRRLSVLMGLALACAAAASALAEDDLHAGPERAATWTPLAPPVPAFFRHDWTRTPLQHPVTQADLVNQQLELKLYGPAGKHILTASAPAASMTAGAPPHVFTGMCELTCAMALRDRKSYVDLSGLGKIRWAVKVSGLHRIHPILKLADGTWLVGEHADENRLDFNISEFNVAETRWMVLDIDRVVTRGDWVDLAKMDLTRVDEIGFTDLMPGSGHGDGGFSDMGWIEVYGKPVPRGGPLKVQTSRETIMLKRMLGLTACLSLFATVCTAQTLPAKWEELTSADFVKAIKQADGVCMLPMGSMEHFGPSAPIGTNVFLAREVSAAAAKQSFMVIFPDYFVASAASSAAEPGTIAYSIDTQMKFLDETTREMARNGCRKIILGNGHTPNQQLINLYMENFRSVPRDYVVYTIYVTAFPPNYSNGGPYPPAMLPSKPGADGHGGEERVAAMLVNHPDLIHLDRAHDEPLEPGHGAEDRNNAPPAGGLSVVPTGYFGDPSGATVERGRALMDWATTRLVKFVQQVKADNKTLALQEELYKRIQQPRMPAK